MGDYIHILRCIQCRGEVVYRNKSDSMDDVPSLRHGELDEYVYRLEHTKSKKASEVSKCLGRLMNAKSYLDAPEEINKKPVDEEWADLETRVAAAWRAFRNSNWAANRRGPNHDRAYRPPPSVLARLQSSGGTIQINRAVYTIAPSLTSHVSLHRQLTPAQGAGGTYQSFIFHL